MEIIFKREAAKFLETIPKKDAHNILENISLLKDLNLIHKGLKKLKDKEDIYSLRVGRYRVLFKKYKDKMVIFIIKIGHRKNIYNKKR